MIGRLGWGWTVTACVVIALAAEIAVADESRWNQWATPSSPPPRVIGGHANGCLAGAQPLPLDGLGYQVMRPSRDRFYGHPTAVAFVREFAAETNARGGRGVLVGDLAQPRGGPMPSGHRSHQTGLDIDIWFAAAPAWTLSREERESIAAVSMLDPQGIGVDPATWTEEHLDLLRTAANFQQVDRIFVNAAIKEQLCRTVSGDRSWLAKIRPWWGHDHHFHVRLRCPEDQAECLDQQPVPAGDGCDETLAWWFSKDAEEELRRLQSAPPHLMTVDDLPPGCRTVLVDSDADLGAEVDGQE